MLALVLAAIIGLAQANTQGPWTTSDNFPVEWTTAPPMMTDSPNGPMMTSMAPHHFTGTHKPHFQTSTPHHGHHHTNYPTTHMPITVDSNEFDTATFYYDSLSHTMVMHLGACYLMKLTPAQQHSVHTPHGLKSIEFLLMRSAALGHRTTLTHDQVVAMSVHLSHMCPSHNAFLVHHVVHHHSTTMRP